MEWNHYSLRICYFKILGHQEVLAQRYVQQIIEVLDGRVLIRLNSSRKKASFSRFSENVKLPWSSYSTPCKSSNCDYLKNNQAEDSQKIYYEAPIAEPIDEASSSIGSLVYLTTRPPTFSSINVISKPYKFSKDYLIRNFNSIEN